MALVCPMWSPKDIDGTFAYTTSSELHWLPVTYRLWDMILIYAYKALDGTVPQYLEEVLVAYHPTICPRFESEVLLTVPQTCSVMHSNRCLGKAVNVRKCNSLDA